MNIAFLTWADSWHIPVKTKYFVSEGHNVFYLGIYPGTGQDIKPAGVTFIPVMSEKKNKYLALIDKCLKVRKLTGELDLDILHIIDMSKAYYAIFSSAKKTVIENNGSDVLMRPKNNFLLRILYPFFYRFADAVVQDSYVTQAAGMKYGASGRENEIIELGIDFSFFNKDVEKGKARKILGIKETDKVVFSPRGLSGLYNIETIIRTIPLVRKRYPDVKYIFCRHFGSEWDSYRELIHEHNAEGNIIFTGFLDNEKDMPYYYADSDLVVSVPSSDSSPRAVYEAMACGVPVIVSELPWYHNKFEAGADINVVPVKDVAGLAGAILNDLEHVKPERIRSAEKKVRENIDMRVHNRKLEELYERIVSP